MFSLTLEILTAVYLTTLLWGCISAPQNQSDCREGEDTPIRTVCSDMSRLYNAISIRSHTLADVRRERARPDS